MLLCVRLFFFLSSRRRHTRCALVTGVQTCALPISVSVVIDFLEGKIPHAELPLDVRATAFQRRVWNELIAIPCGETRTYSEIAEIMGVPRGQRAVGRACATNPVSLVIPCHRSEEHTSELQSLMRKSYAVLCLQKKKKK